MPVLERLEGIKARQVECEFITKSSQIKRILNSGKAATAAGSHGAINIWKDDKSFIRCEAHKFKIPVDKQKFSTINEVKKWADKWIKEIQIENGTSW